MTHDAPAPETPAAPPAPARRMNGAVAGYVALGVSVGAGVPPAGSSPPAPGSAITS